MVDPSPRPQSESPGRVALESCVRSMRRRPRTWLTAYAVLLAVQISPWWYPKQDSCTYLSIARSLADGPPVTNLGRPQLSVLPGYPALISPAFLAGSRPFLVISIAQWVLAVALMLGVYRWSRRFAPSLAVLITGLAILNTALWYHYRRPLKEIAFMAAAVWTVNALHALAACEKKTRWQTAGRAALAAALLIATIAVRYTGIVLIGGYFLAVAAAAHRGRMSWRFAWGTTLAVGLPMAALVAGYLRYEHQQSVRYGGSATYLKLFASALKSTVADDSAASENAASSGGLWGGRLLEGTRLQISDVSRVTMPGMFKAYGKPGEWLHPTLLVALVVWIVVILGWRRIAIDKLDVLACAAPLYLVLYAIWARGQGARFAVPLVPLAMACVCLGLPYLGEYFARRRDAILAGFLVLHLGVAASYWLFVDAPRAYHVHQDWTAIERFATRIDTEEGPVAMLRSVHKPGSELQKNRLMVQYAIDRPVGWVLIETGDKRPENYRWIVSRGQYDMGPGFALLDEADGLVLYERRAHAPPQTAPAGVAGTKRATRISQRIQDSKTR